MADVIAREPMTLLVVEDDAIVRSWLRGCLEGSKFRIVGEAAGAREAIELARRRRPRLLLVDYRLPDGLGTALVRRLRENGLDAPVLLVTANAEEGLNELAWEAGVQGTTLKSASAAGLLEAIRAVAAGGRAFDPAHPRRRAGRAALTPRERDVLRLVAAGATNHEVAEKLGVGHETVKTLVSRTLRKLGARRRAEAVSTAQKLGLL